MKNIKINISNFGPIKEPHTIELAPFIVLSGNSGVGKSYVAMLIHFVYRVICGEELEYFFKEKNIDFETLKKELPKEGGIIYRFDIEDFKQWLNRRALQYMRDILNNGNFVADINIKFPLEAKTFTFVYSCPMISNDEADSLESISLSLDDKEAISYPYMGSQIPFILFMKILLSKFIKKDLGISVNDTFFMPPSRGALLTVSDSLRFELRTSGGMYSEFIKDFSELKDSKQNVKPTSSNQEDINKILHNEVLHGSIQLVDDNIIYTAFNKSMPITAAASSIKELVPFALMIQKNKLGDYSILFEEPEAHLHPELQLVVGNILACALNEGTHIQITTHSDYLMRHINDMMRLHIIRQKLNDEQQFEKYCEGFDMDPRYTIDSQKVRAYYFQMDEHGISTIKEQDISNGIPFDTFENITEKQLIRSSKLYDDVEYGF
ncbi:MAG: AAA family ATPase [Prevotella sp.]|nr:AAA family ATPase [Prevotella sp.]